MTILLWILGIWIGLGIIIWVHAVLTEEWGAFFLYPHYALLIILGYPVLAIRYAYKWLRGEV